jgi:hypothetical protein
VADEPDRATKMMDGICWRCPASLDDDLEHVTVSLKMADSGGSGVLGAARLVEDVFMFAMHSHPSSHLGPRGTLAAAHRCQCAGPLKRTTDRI